MNSIQKKSFFNSLNLSMMAIATFLLCWELFLSWVIFIQGRFDVKVFNLTWWELAFIFSLGIFFGYLTQRYNIKKVFPVAVIFVIFWGIASYLSTVYFDYNLHFLRTSFAVLIPVFIVHLRRLWKIDIALTEKLVSLSSAGQLLEGKPAEARIESGLKLLETVLPLSEAIVFRIDEEDNLEAVGRSRSNLNNEAKNPSLRQDIWRDIIELCERSLASGQTVVSADEKIKGAAQIAIPLICESRYCGVLYVKVSQDFEKEDKYLLEAFSGQLARNFQRKELRNRDLPNKFWWSFLSAQSAENRVEMTKLINTNIKEQTYSVIASSYLKEAHAIAYLDGTLAYLNRQMRHTAKVNTNNIFELDLFSLLEHFKTEVFSEPRLALRRVLQTGEPYINELFFPETGKTLKMQISLVKVPSDEQSIHDTNVPMKPACILVTIRNITAVKENERLRSDMASLMSHELRTPITSIQGFAELLLTDETIKGENREFLTIIADESQRLSKMLATFLSVSKLEQSDKQEFQKTPVKLDTVVNEVVNELQDTARKKRIRLVENATAHLPPIAADKGLISRAVSNIIDNAIKYSPERTSVMISTVLETEFLRVVVEDRGYGIPKNEQEKIWQKFYRVAREGQDKAEESTGLGLSLVKEIVEQHGGEVEVESEVGFGSKFSLKLPRL